MTTDETQAALDLAHAKIDALRIYAERVEADRDRAEQERDAARADLASAEHDLARLIETVRNTGVGGRGFFDDLMLCDEIERRGRPGWLAAALAPERTEAARAERETIAELRAEVERLRVAGPHAACDRLLRREVREVAALDAQIIALRSQVAAMKLRALAAHEAIWRAMNGRPSNAVRALMDDGEVHEAVHAIIAVDTESVSAPEEWRAHVERQDRRIETLEAEHVELHAEADRWREVARKLGDDAARLRARDEALRGVVEGTRDALDYIDDRIVEATGPVLARLEDLDHILTPAREALDAAEIEAVHDLHDLHARCGVSDAERAAESAGEPATRDGAAAISAERRRQIEAEGWSAKHDDAWDHEQLAWAAVCYAAPSSVYMHNELGRGHRYIDPWPWEPRWDKRASTDRIGALTKAGALIAAEIDRLQRAVDEPEVARLREVRGEESRQ